ncbi:MAG: flagellar biosynthetic protein FliO [Pseudomonadota bacterium]
MALTLTTVTPLFAADNQAQAERTLGQQYLSVMPALILILLLIVGLAFLVKKFNPALGRGNPLIRVVATLPLGGKERLIMVQTGDTCLLLGVTPGQIQTLHVVNKDSVDGLNEITSSVNPAAGFAGILQSVIRR